ncbi:MAG: MBL fold metallo-hydrolase, partial [Firmicutes bacterium]|nr:MBL fold metallo-hydrolase [Bacillota bacterium]
FAAAMKGIKVYVDSPMAKSATEIFKRNAQVYDEETTELIMQGINPLSFEGLVFVRDVFESQTLNHDTSPKVIISASGMCEAGRIKHHLKHNLWDSRNSIIFAGYQAEGTLGRSIVDGVKEVKIFGEPIHVAAEIYNLKGFSGHADRNALLQWLSAFETAPEKIFLVHGEQKSKENFRALVKERLGVDAVVITGESTADLSEGLHISGGRAARELEKYEELIELRRRLAEVHHRIDHILYTTTLAADDSMSDERIQKITDAVMYLEKGTVNLGAVVTDEGEPPAYDAERG